ncbi:hypothetical protein [Herbaspirillum sp. YR522]|uniref:hypothetical protein n=1 Tax=Herbaspirillum sp. YR522 TaxID=1144342 RepID=UPI0012FAC52E|nr:hypothetical protein [Herbaspirillum sp. YR522]
MNYPDMQESFTNIDLREQKRKKIFGHRKYPVRTDGTAAAPCVPPEDRPQCNQENADENSTP